MSILRSENSTKSYLKKIGFPKILQTTDFSNVDKPFRDWHFSKNIQFWSVEISLNFTKKWKFQKKKWMLTIELVLWKFSGQFWKLKTKNFVWIHVNRKKSPDSNAIPKGNIKKIQRILFIQSKVRSNYTPKNGTSFFSCWDINTSTTQHINTSTQSSTHPYINSHRNIINTSTYQHINSDHNIINTSTHQRTAHHRHIDTSIPQYFQHIITTTYQ